MHEPTPSSHSEVLGWQSEGSDLGSRGPELRAQAECGAEYFYRMSGAPRDYHISSEHKLLFSTISETDDSSGFPVAQGKVAKFTALGFEYAGKRHEFNESYRQSAHEAVLTYYLADSVDRDDFVRRLHTSYDWGSCLRETLDVGSKAWATEYISSQCQKLEESARKMRRNAPAYEMRRYIFEDDAELDFIAKGKLIEKERRERQEKIKKALDQYLLDHGLLTKDEINEYDSYKNRRLELSNKLISLCSPRDSKELLDLILNYGDGKKLSVARGIKGDDSRRPVYNALRSRVRHEYAKTYSGSVPGNLPTTEKNNLLKYLAKNCPEDKWEEAFATVDKLCDMEDRYATHLLPNYVNTKYLLLNPEAEKIRELESKVAIIRKNRAQLIKKLTDQKTEQKMSSIKAQLMSIELPNHDTDSDCEIGFFPTGCLIISNDDPFISSLSPMNERVTRVMQEFGVFDAWNSFWLEHQSDCDEIVRRALVGSFANDVNLVDDDFNGRVRSYSEKYQIDFPPAMNIVTGEIYDSVQPKDLDTIEANLPPVITGFIDRVDLAHPNGENSLKSTRLEALRFLNGQGHDEMTLCGQGRTLHVRAMEDLTNNTEREKHDKIIGRTLVQIGASNYLNLSAKKRREFGDLIDARLNISEPDFYRYFGRKSMGSNDKRAVLERTLFVKCFLDYINDEASAPITKYFDSIKKSPALPGQ